LLQLNHLVKRCLWQTYVSQTIKRQGGRDRGQWVKLMPTIFALQFAFLTCSACRGITYNLKITFSQYLNSSWLSLLYLSACLVKKWWFLNKNIFSWKIWSKYNLIMYSYASPLSGNTELVYIANETLPPFMFDLRSTKATSSAQHEGRCLLTECEASERRESLHLAMLTSSWLQAKRRCI
jgi:hypothetical protein